MNISSANIESSKTQLHKKGLSGGFSGRTLQPLVKTGLENVLETAKSALITLE